MKTEALERASYIATISAALVGIAALVFGYFQFADTQRAQRETLQLEREVKAIDLTLRFVDLETAGVKAKDRASFRDQQAVAIAESIFNLVGDDPGWKATVKWMVEAETKYIQTNLLGCESFNADFIGFTKTIAGQNICAPAADTKQVP
jgi:hypothetical protein